MKIDPEKCRGCRACHPYCTTGAIFSSKVDGKRKSQIDQDICVECGACQRSEICPNDAIFMPELAWPRLVRAQFGNPYFHPQIKTGIQTPPEIKVNDITGRIPSGTTEIVVEVGRPGVGTSFLDVQKVCTALIRAGMTLHAGSGLATIMEDLETARLREDVLTERALNVMIQGRIETPRLRGILAGLKQVSAEIDSVFSLSLVNRLEDGLGAPALPIAIAEGFQIRPHAKTNVGLGRRFEGKD